MEINKFKKGQRVHIVTSGANASQFNEGLGNVLGVYQHGNWKYKTFIIEGTIKLTGFGKDLAPSAHLLTDLNGKPVGYVYSYAIEPLKEKEYSYSASTNTIWFDRDNGRVTATSLDEAKEIATAKYQADLDEMNRRLDGFAKIEANLDEMSIEEIK